MKVNNCIIAKGSNSEKLKHWNTWQGRWGTDGSLLAGEQQLPQRHALQPGGDGEQLFLFSPTLPAPVADRVFPADAMWAGER